MTAEEFAQRKQRIKSRALAAFLALGVGLTVFFEFLGWIYGLHGYYPTERIEDLRVAKGEYFVRTYYRTRAPDYQTGIRDPKTGEVIVTANDGLCNVGNGGGPFPASPPRSGTRSAPAPERPRRYTSSR